MNGVKEDSVACMDNLLTIDDLAAETRVPTRTIRQY